MYNEKGGSMFERFELLIGNKMEILKNKTIMIIGLGGVGGHAFESLVRSDIKNIIVIDNDVVDITNLNRQALAYRTTIGKYKVEIAEELAHNINPNCHVKKHCLFLNRENIDNIFQNKKIDFVIDAIDTVETKKIIIKKCLKENIPFISVMGTGNKMHPELLEIADIRKTEYDPIAKVIRKMIKEDKINKKIPVIFSKEKPVIKGKVGSNAFVPCSAGLLAASFVINKLLEETHE